MFRLTWHWTVLTLLDVACVTLFILEGNAGSAPTSPRPSAAPESRKPEKSTTAKPEAPIENATVLPVDAIDGRILAALQKRVDVDFIQISLGQLADWATLESGIEIALDREHVEPYDEVTLSLHGVTIKTVLDLVFAEYKMGYIVRDQSLFLTTKERAQRATLVQVYPVSDLVPPRRRLGKTIRDYRSLYEVILATVEPASWQALGDRASISVCQGALSIRQSLDAHRQIADLLRHLRDVRDRQLRGELASPPLPLDAPNARAIAALRKQLKLQCKQEPLSALATRLQEELGVSFFVDRVALNDSQIDAEATEINCDMAVLPLSTALALILDPLEIDFAVRDGVVFISTKRAINTTSVSRAYPVADLLESEGGGAVGDATAKAHLVDAITKAMFANDADRLASLRGFKLLDNWKILVACQSDANHQRITAMLAALRFAKAVRNKSLPSSKKTEPADDFELRVYSIEPLAKGDAPLAAAQAAESLIRETIARESWSDRRAYIKALPNRIVIRNQRAVHEEVSELLDQLAKPGLDEYIEVVSN